MNPSFIRTGMILEKENYDFVKEYAQEENFTVHQVINFAIDFFLKKHSKDVIFTRRIKEITTPVSTTVFLERRLCYSLKDMAKKHKIPFKYLFNEAILDFVNS